MNNTSRYIANLYNVLLNVRDTLEFTFNREHPTTVYNARKLAIEEGLRDNSALKNFLDNNGDKGKEIATKLKEFIDEIYGADSTVLVVSGDQIRVDHTQHLKIYEYVVGIEETLRDVILSYINYARQHNESEEIITKLVVTDEALYRAALNKVVLADLEKSFLEFNKLMNESKGQPTPQSNFIVQNEINKYAGYLRFSRAHTHLIDNKSLDMLDQTIQLVEMVEGRRERRDNKSFQLLFQEAREGTDAYLRSAEEAWKSAYRPVFDEMVELAKQARENANNGGDNN